MNEVVANFKEACERYDPFYRKSNRTWCIFDEKLEDWIFPPKTVLDDIKEWDKDINEQRSYIFTLIEENPSWITSKRYRKSAKE